MRTPSRIATARCVPACGRKFSAGVLGAEPRLDGVAGEADLRLREPERLAAGDAQLPFDQIDPGDRLGHRMLDLQPRVHLHEIEIAVAHRAGTRPCRRPHSRSLARGDRGGAHAARAMRRRPPARRFLDQLLVAALHRAVALAEMDHIAVPVGEHLHLDVARARRSRAPGSAAARRKRAAPPIARCERGGELAAACATSRMPRPPPPADRLDHQRKADRAARPRSARRRSGRRPDSRARSARRPLQMRFAPALSPICRIAAGGGPTQTARHRSGLREIRVLGEEAIARMHGVGAAGLAAAMIAAISR